MVRRKPKLWPYATAFALAALLWTLHVMAGYYEHWQATGIQAPDMGISIRNGVLAAAGIVLVLYGAGFAWMQRGASRATESGAAQAATPAATSVARDGARAAMLAQTGQRFVLEVRGVGVVTGPDTNIEIWKEIEAKANNHVSYLSTDPNDYPESPDDQLNELRLATGVAFKVAARKAVEYWPVPIIIWEAPKDKKNGDRPAASIMGLRQQASLGVTLFLWEADANTDDGAAMVQKLFDFFDAHPDVPSALIYSTDGTLTRKLLGAPGSGKLLSERYRIPDMPDSVGAILVSRSDRVDRLIRPFAVEQTANVNKDTTEYDITKLWNFYWKTSDDQGPDSFTAHYDKQQLEDTGDAFSGTAAVSSDWWIKHLPDLWRDIGNKGPGQFTPSPYIPVRWTTWQVKAFDEAPLLGYWHRPIDIKLIDAHGKPLRGPEQAEALKAGWDKALATLPEGEKPKRVFYDTTGDKQWVIPLTQAFALVGPSAPQLGDVKEGYDIGARIANTGVSSPLVQVGLGLIAGYVQGGASATINRRPNGTATITMVSPPDAATKAAWVQQHGKADPFGGVHPLD
ncbi:type VI lipase adapter Tla3 domain-containing protein [Ralstonia nicotianae]